MIVSLEDMKEMVEDWRGVKPSPTIALTSGGYDPIHPGHISVLTAAKELLCVHANVTLVVVVNDDDFLIKKKGLAFMPQDVRCEIVDSIREVDFTIPFRPTKTGDMTVCEAIEVLRPDYFLKGGDRGRENTPERSIALKCGTTMMYDVGENKKWSSSDYLRNYLQRRLNELVI